MPSIATAGQFSLKSQLTVRYSGDLVRNPSHSRFLRMPVRKRLQPRRLVRYPDLEKMPERPTNATRTTVRRIKSGLLSLRNATDVTDEERFQVLEQLAQHI